MSEVALALCAPGTVEGTLEQIVDLAVGTVDGCDAAGLFLVEDEQVFTPASTDPIVVELDRLQFDTDEGPGLDAVCESAICSADDLAVDPRWPRFGPAAAEGGCRSVLSFRLPGQRPIALSLYARRPAAFGATDRAEGLILATLAGIALRVAEQRSDDETRAESLHPALLTHGVIGQAQGLLMERERITADQASEALRRASQHLNIKVREAAQRLVETGETSRPG